MTETIPGMSSMPKDAKKRTSSSTASARERAAIADLVKAARERGEDITGPDGLLTSITTHRGVACDRVRGEVVPLSAGWKKAKPPG